MSGKKKTRYFGLVLCLICLAFVVDSCKRNPSGPLPPAGTLVSATDCKGGNAGTAKASASFDSDDEECIKYDFDNGTLRLTHVNGSFNCCPKEISGDVQIDFNMIVIRERELEIGCKCDCLYDTEYQIENLPVGIYRIQIFYDYQSCAKICLDETIDFSASPEGIVCKPRP